MNKKFELVIIATVSLALVGAGAVNGMSALAQGNMTNASKVGTMTNMTNASKVGGNMTIRGMAGSTYGGVDIDSSSGVINCDGKVKGPVKTEGIQADAFVRHGAFAGAWTIVNEKFSQDKGGAVTGGWTDGKKYQLKGQEQYDGICKAKLPKDITISGDCGTGVEIKYATVDGKSDTFKGNARCYISPANLAVKAGNMTVTETIPSGMASNTTHATLGNITGNTTESLNLTAKFHQFQK
jgi:hypothetical protein